MPGKSEIKDIQSLRHKKSREETGLFVAEGPKITGELATLAPQQVKKIYGVEEWVGKHKDQLSNVDYEIISETELQRLSQLQTPNEVLAVFYQFESNVPVNPNGIILYLDAVQDPGNFGTIVRIADWFGIQHIVCGDGCADLYNIKVVQASMGSIARVNVFYDEEFGWLKKQQLTKYAASLTGKSLDEVPAIQDGILVIGNESKGIQPSIMEMVDERITIPKKGTAESLNAAVATGIILSHLMK